MTWSRSDFARPRPAVCRRFSRRWSTIFIPDRREIRPTQAEWRQAIDFLTEVGHASDEQAPGMGAAVGSARRHRAGRGDQFAPPEGATPNTVRGPFYRADAPQLPLGADISLDGVGEPLEVSGRVQDLDGDADRRRRRSRPGRPMRKGSTKTSSPTCSRNSTCAASSPPTRTAASTTAPSSPPAMACRTTARSGRCLPQLGYPLRRPAHLHFLIRRRDFETMTTHSVRARRSASGRGRAVRRQARTGRRLQRSRRQAVVELVARFQFRHGHGAQEGAGRHEPERSPIPAARPISSSANGASDGGRRDGSRSSAASDALVLSTPHQEADGEALAKRLGSLAVGVFSGAAMHTPVDVTEAAMAKATERQGRLRRRARRRLDHRARQGDRLSHRPAADRHPDHLCRLGGDADPRPDREWRKDHACAMRKSCRRW